MIWLISGIPKDSQEVPAIHTLVRAAVCAFGPWHAKMPNYGRFYWCDRSKRFPGAAVCSIACSRAAAK